MPDGTVKIFGVELSSVPRWFVVAMGCAVLAGIGISWYWNNVRNPGRELVSLKEANAALLESIQEYNMHLADTPELQMVLRDDVRGKVTSSVYQDGCILLAKTGGPGLKPKSKLIVDLLKDGHPHASFRDWFETPVSAQGRCLANHGGRFSVSYGQKNGCMVPMFRTYEDGCVQSQRINSCNGILDPPFWVKCVH